MQRYSRFAAYLRPVASQIGLLFFLTVASMLITIPVPMWQRDIIDNAIPRSDRRLLLVSVSLIAAFYGLHYVLNYLRTLTSSRTKENVLKRIRVELYDKLQRMSVRSLARRQSGEMLSRILHDAGFVQHLLSDEFFLVIGSAVKVTILLYLMAVIHLPLTLLCLSLLPVAVAILLVFRKRVYRSSLELHKTMAALSGRMQENLAAAKLIQAQTLEQEKLQQTLLLTENLEAVNIRRAKIGISGNLLMSLLI